MRVMSCELWKYGARRTQQLCRANLVGKVGVALSSKYWVIGHSQLLCVLDLPVPVRALYQPNHQTPIGFARQSDKPVTCGYRPFLIGL